jgi:transposase
MGLLNIIRRMHLRQKLSIREIARLTGVSRNTVSKHLAANTIEPKFATPERQSKLDPFAEKLAGWLKTEAGKSRKERRTVKQLHAEPPRFHLRPISPCYATISSVFMFA